MTTPNTDQPETHEAWEERQTMSDDVDDLRRELAQAKAEIQGLKNKFDCALTMAAVAENRLHHHTKPIHNGVGEADMYSQEEYEKLMQQ